MTDYEKQMCQKCDSYRGYVCAEHRDPPYNELVLDNEQLKAKIARMSRDYDRKCDELFQQKELARQQIRAMDRLLDRVRLMIEEHDGMISVEDVDTALKPPEGFGDERRQDTEPPCPWCGAESKWSNGPHQRFVCGSGVDVGWVPDRWQSDWCKLNCAKQENAKLRERVGVAYDQIRKWIDLTHVLSSHERFPCKACEHLMHWFMEQATPYRVENHDPAQVEQGEWRSDFKPDQLGEERHNDA